MTTPSIKQVLSAFYARYAGHAVLIPSKLEAATFLAIAFSLFGKDITNGQYKIGRAHSTSFVFRFGGRYEYDYHSGSVSVGAALSLDEAEAAVRANNFDAVFGMMDGGGYENPIPFNNHYALFVKMGDTYALCDEFSPLSADLQNYQWVDITNAKRTTYSRFFFANTLYTSEKGYRARALGMFDNRRYVLQWLEGEDAGLLSPHLWTPNMVSDKPVSQYAVGDVVILKGDPDAYECARVITEVVSAGKYRIKTFSGGTVSGFVWSDHEIKGLSAFPWEAEPKFKVESTKKPAKFKVGDKVVALKTSPYRSLFIEDYGVVREVIEGVGYHLDFYSKSTGTFESGGNASWYDYELEAYAPTHISFPTPSVDPKPHEMYVLNKDYAVDGRSYPKGTRLFTKAEMLALPYKQPIVPAWAKPFSAEYRYIVHENGHAAPVTPANYDAIVVTE